MKNEKTQKYRCFMKNKLIKKKKSDIYFKTLRQTFIGIKMTIKYRYLKNIFRIFEYIHKNEQNHFFRDLLL